jgi:hypothetical protein
VKTPVRLDGKANERKNGSFGLSLMMKYR